MAGRAKLQQKRWHLDGGVEVLSEQEKDSVTTYLGNITEGGDQQLALVAYTGSYYDLIDYPNLTNFVVDGDYVHTDNNFTDEDKSKLANLFNYTLPIATEKILGGIRVGDHLEMRQELTKDGKPFGDFDRLSVIESHFIYIQNAIAGKFPDIPKNSAGAMTVRNVYNPRHEDKSINGHYIRYNDMAFFSEDPEVKTKTVNGMTQKYEQDYMSKGGLWWTTKNAGRWIRVLDQFNIMSFNKRVGDVVPVGMDDLKTIEEDYNADMVGAIARRGIGGNWTQFKNKAGRVMMEFFNGSSLKGLEDNSAGWARIGCLGWDEEKGITKPDTINSPTGGVVQGVYWKYSGLPTLPAVYETTKSGKKKLVQPPTYRGINNTSMFFMPDGQDRIWVKRSSGECEFDDNEWFYLEQLPIATRTRLGGVIIGGGLDITEEGVLSVSGIVTSWTGKQGERRVNDVVAMNGDYDAKMITFGDVWSSTNNVDYELKRLERVKAPLNSPAFSGTPTTPTPSQNDSSAKIVNTSWVRQYVTNAIQSIVAYDLPPATATQLGGIKVGNGLTITADGTLSVNIQGGGSGSGSGPGIVVDTTLSTSSTNPVENRVIAGKFADYVLKTNGTATNLSVNKLSVINLDSRDGYTYAATMPPGDSSYNVATTAFVINAINTAIQTIGGNSGGGVTINPYTLPPASSTTRGGVRVNGNEGIKIKNTDVIYLDTSYITSYLDGDATYNQGGVIDYITAKENITGGKFEDIPMNSSGKVKLSAAYSPTSVDMEGYYIKYNAGNNPNSYIMWFCDFNDNNSYYLVHKNDSEWAWSMMFSVDGSDNFEDFDISLYAKLNSPSFTGTPSYNEIIPYPSGNNSLLANVGYVHTAINRGLADQKKASKSDYGVVRVGDGINVNNGVISMDGVISFNGRSGDVSPGNDDYEAPMIKYSGNVSGSTVKAAIDTLGSVKAPLANPKFTGQITVNNKIVATEDWVKNTWAPTMKATTSKLGMIIVGDGLQVDSNGVLSTSGSVTGWTGNQGTRQSGEVIATAGDYNSNMIYYDPQDGSKTVRSELDLKAYNVDVWHKKDIVSLTYTNTDMPQAYTGGKFGSYGGHIMLPMGYYSGQYGAIILKNDANSYGNNVESIPNVYIASTYVKLTGQTGQNSHTTLWGNTVRLLTVRDLASPNFTGTPTINNKPIFVSSVASASLGLVKNGGNVVVDSSGNMNYVLPVATASVLGGVKAGGNISVDSDGKMDYTLPTATPSVLGGVKVGSGLTATIDGTLSVSGAVTTFNSRTGDVLPVSGDYNATQVTYDQTKSVKDKLDDVGAEIGNIKNGSALPIASATQIGAVKIGDGINVDANGTISMSGVTSFNGREGAIIPQGDEVDYNADMVGAIARNENLNVSANTYAAYNSGIPGNTAGYLKYPYLQGTGIPEISGGYISLQKKEGATLGRKHTLLFQESYIYDQYYNGSWNKSAKVAGSGAGLYYSLGYGWARIDGVGTNYDTSRTYYIGSKSHSNAESNFNRFFTQNRGGVLKVSVPTDISSDRSAIATFVDVSSNVYEYWKTSDIRSIVNGVQYSLTLSSFYKNDNSMIQGVFYNRSTGSAPNSVNEEWVKFIDTENIYDYVADTSNLYNTENYTNTEIDAEIAATLAELNA